MVLENQSTLTSGATNAMYFKTGTTGTSYTGAIKTIGTSPQSSRLGLFTYASSDKAGSSGKVKYC